MMFRIFFSLHGFFALLAQVVILRELLVAFYGNELFSGVVLGIWLLSTGLGSLLALKLTKLKSLRIIFLLQIFLIALSLLVIFLIRFYISKAVSPGQIPPVFQSFLFVFFTLFPFCFLLDALFAWTSHLWVKKAKKGAAQLICQAYLLETIGLTLAGLVFNFFLIKTTFPFPSSFNNRTLKFRFPNLVESVNSYYGNITVTELNHQYNFYESGNFIGSNKEVEGNEYFSHLILTQHPKPKNILLIGGGLNGLIFEILKYPSIEKIEYVELDPKLVEIQKKYIPVYLIKALENPKVKIHLTDGRQFLKETQQKYDVVIFNLPNPSTALINRFYTQEAFKEAKEILEEEGVFAFSLFAPIDYLSQEAKDLVSLINQTLESVFEKTLVLPEETEILFLASKETLVDDPKIIKSRFQESKITTSFVTPDYLEYRLTSPQIKKIKAIIKNQGTEKVNLDFQPLAYFYESAFWQTIFSFKTAKLFKTLSLIDFKFAFLTVLIIYYLLFTRLKTHRQISFFITSLAGFTLMSFEILIIFIFQVVLGLIFSKIALIFTVILASMAIGNLWATKKKLEIKPIFFAIVVYSPFFVAAIKKIPQELSFYFLASIIGFLTGTVFPLANKMLFRQEKEGALQTGFLYAADLLGAFLGAILPSLFLIPVFGVIKTVILLGIINTFPLLKKLGP